MMLKIVLFLGGMFLVACVHTNVTDKVPGWAMHIKKPAVDQSTRVQDLEAKLVTELESDRLGPDYVSAEQIAALAVREIKMGNGFDAAVLLSLASYRYHQQSVYAYERSRRDKSEEKVRLTRYSSLVEAEIFIFNSLNFNKELDYLSSRLEETDKLAQMYESARLQILLAPDSIRESLSTQLMLQLEQAYTLPEETLRYPRLAKAFRTRLVADTTSDYHTVTSSLYLSQTPLLEYQRAALKHVNQYFWIPICRRMAKRLSVYEKDVLIGLTSPRPMERSNSAIILGLRPAEKYVRILEHSHQIEKDPMVRLALEFALVKHNRGNPDRIVASIRSCHEETPCELAIQMLHWLPSEIMMKVEPELFVGILSDSANTEFSRYFAATILNEIGQNQRLKREHVTAMLEATEDKNETVAEVATEMIRTLPQLNRERLFARLREDGTPKAALFLRWAEIVEPWDIGNLSIAVGQMSGRSLAEQEAIVMALSRIPGQRAADLLIDCFKQYEELRVVIAMVLLDRKDTRYKVLLDLARQEGGDALASLALQLGVRAPGARAFARNLLMNGTVEQRVHTIGLIGLFKHEDLYSELWRLSQYSDREDYPGDAFVRRAAMAAIIWNEIASAKRVTSRPEYIPEPSSWRTARIQE